MRDNIRPWYRPGAHEREDEQADDYEAALAEPADLRIRDVILVCIGLAVGHIATIIWR